MLNHMRDNLASYKWVLWLVAIAMVAYLGAFFSCDDPASNPGSGWAAMVNDRPIGTQDFLATARNIDRYYRDLFGTNYEQLKGQIRVGSQAIEGLIDEEIVMQEAERMGLSASTADVAELIRDNPQFRDADGSFIGKERYIELVRRGFPGGAAQYEDSLRRQIVLQRWTDVVTTHVDVDEAELERTYRQRNEKTAIDYVVVASAQQDVDTEVDESEARAWYDAHAQDYLRPDGRRIRYVVVSRETAAQGVEIGEDDIRAAYEAAGSRYDRPEQRRARHILFGSTPGSDAAGLRAQAEAALARIRDGEDFGELAQALSTDAVSAEQGGDLGFFARGDMTTNFDQAAFETPVGEMAPIVETEFGVHLLEVTDSRAASKVPLEEARANLERTLRIERSQAAVVAGAQSLKSSIASPDDLAAAAEREGLELRSRFVSADDRMSDIGASPEFRDGVMELEVGAVSAPLAVAAGLALVVVDELVPSQVAPYDEVVSQVQADLLNDRARRAAMSAAQKALRDKDLGIVDAAKRLGLEIKQSGDLGPSATIPGTGGSTAELRDALFGDAVQLGDRGVLEVPAGALVYQIMDRQPFDPTGFEAARSDLRAELVNQRRSSVRQAIIDQLREQQTVVTNEPLITQTNG